MYIENTKENWGLKNTVASMAIEDMYFSDDFIREMLKVTKGEKTSDELRQELLKKYIRC